MSADELCIGVALIVGGFYVFVFLLLLIHSALENLKARFVERAWREAEWESILDEVEQNKEALYSVWSGGLRDE